MMHELSRDLFTDGGAALKLPIVGGLRRHRTELVIGLTVRIIDVRTGEIAASTTTYGRASRKKIGLGGAGERGAAAHAGTVGGTVVAEAGATSGRVRLPER